MTQMNNGSRALYIVVVYIAPKTHLFHVPIDNEPRGEWVLCDLGGDMKPPAVK